MWKKCKESWSSDHRLHLKHNVTLASKLCGDEPWIFRYCNFYLPLDEIIFQKFFFKDIWLVYKYFLALYIWKCFLLSFQVKGKLFNLKILKDLTPSFSQTSICIFLGHVYICKGIEKILKGHIKRFSTVVISVK